MTEPPFVIQLAGYVLDFHERNRCRRCGPDGWCSRVALARAQLIVWRQRRQRIDDGDDPAVGPGP